jgi:hypothetical protein
LKLDAFVKTGRTDLGPMLRNRKIFSPNNRIKISDSDFTGNTSIYFMQKLFIHKNNANFVIGKRRRNIDPWGLFGFFWP